jgi:hypothetical protein
MIQALLLPVVVVACSVFIQVLLLGYSPKMKGRFACLLVVC